MSSANSRLIELEIKKSRSDTARAVSILNRGFFIYFIFILFAVLGFINGLIGRDLLNVFITLGIISLFVGVIPYFRIFTAVENNIKGFMKNAQ